ncbi:MAG: hypothetical protein ACTHJ3_09500, partial [Pararhizobium sp.]
FEFRRRKLLGRDHLSVLADESAVRKAFGFPARSIALRHVASRLDRRACFCKDSPRTTATMGASNWEET